MHTITQHEAAELWELARDHHVAAGKLEHFSNEVSDTQLRSTLDQHARRFRQAAQQIEGFMQGSGSSSSFAGAPSNFGQQRFGGTGNGGTSYGMSSGFQQGGQQGSFGQGQSLDITVVADCLAACKCMATGAMRGALEASQPARNFLYQLAGEHLNMAEQHYHWLEQHGAYASPKTDQQAIQQYTQKLGQISQSGQAIRSQGMGQSMQHGQHYGYGQHMQTGQQTHQYGQSGQYSQTSQFGQSGQFAQSNPSSHTSQFNQQ